MKATPSRTFVRREDRAAAGKALRRASPRRGHGEWANADDDRDPVALLEARSTAAPPR